MLAAFGVLLLVTAACGNDDPAANPTDVAEDTTAGDTAAEEPPPTEPAGGGEVIPGAFCAQIESAQDAFEAFEATDPATDPGAGADFGGIIGQAAEALRQMDPPAEIRDDWNQIVAAIDEMIAVFGDVDFSDPATFQDLADDPEMQQRIVELEESMAGVEAASERVTDYVREKCGIEL
jgi:hypothetical protein